MNSEHVHHHRRPISIHETKRSIHSRVLASRWANGLTHDMLLPRMSDRDSITIFIIVVFAS